MKVLLSNIAGDHTDIVIGLNARDIFTIDDFVNYGIGKYANEVDDLAAYLRFVTHIQHHLNGIINRGPTD